MPTACHRRESCMAILRKMFHSCRAPVADKCPSRIDVYAPPANRREAQNVIHTGSLRTFTRCFRVLGARRGTDGKAALDCAATASGKRQQAVWILLMGVVVK